MTEGGILHFDATWRGWRLRMTPFRGLLLTLATLFVFLAAFRLLAGLGASTNLNDRWPWGLWIGADLTAVALAGAGYSMCMMAHILHIDDFHALSRRGMLISLLGYVFVLLTLFLEVGRWDNAYIPLFSWGHASPLFEVFVAITIYMAIQVIEFSEVATERIFHSANRHVQRLLPSAFLVGAILPFGHQASLGAIYLLMKGRLHPLWWSTNLPWFFLITSFYVGPAMVILESLWSEHFFGRAVETRVLTRLARISACIMILYTLLKFLDLTQRGELHHLATPAPESALFLVETLLCTLLPALVALSPWGRQRTGLLAFALPAIAGLILSRVNVVFTGMHRAIGGWYLPSFSEWGITLGLLAAVVLAYLFIVENFNIFTRHS
nr:hydrogenase [uncultured Holophaga sp.]